MARVAGPTHTNLYVLGELMRSIDASGGTPILRVDATTAPHAKRLMRFGLLVVAPDGSGVLPSADARALLAGDLNVRRGYFGGSD